MSNRSSARLAGLMLGRKSWNELRTSHSNEVGDEDVDLSVVMACYTEERLPSIDAAVASLRRQTLKARAVIIAVDNNESLAHLLRKRFDWVAVVLNRSNRGASSTRNRGVEGGHQVYCVS
jgi:Glycosyl transferase family 2